MSNKLKDFQRFTAVVVLGLSCVFSTGLVFAQAVTAQISGTAKDQSGAALPGVEITATQTDTGTKRTTTTDESGSYLLSNLPIGPYRLEAVKSGFRTYAQVGIVLQVDSNPEIPIALTLGQVNETVEVSANATSVETRSMGVGSVVENQRILDLPLNGRNPTDLIALAGASVQTSQSPAWAMKTGINISVAGGQPYGVTYLLDGAQHSNFYDATGMPLPFPDALQEFKLETSSLTAQNGGHSGAAVNGVTKSGTNAIHGDLFEFLRNGDLNARNFFAAKRDSLKRNQFGGTVGGAIKKDKLFYFGGYQGTTIRSDPSDATAFVPTAQELAGDFTTFASAQCQGANKTLVGGFSGNKINPASFSPAAVKIAAQLPKTADPCGKVLFGLPLSENDGQYVGRIDYQLSTKQTIFGRYLTTTLHNAVPYNLTKNPLATATPAGSAVASYGQHDLAQSATLGDTYLISANMVNSFRASLNRVAGDHPGPVFYGPQDVGINAYSLLPHFMDMTVTGGFATGAGTSADLTIYWTALQANDDVSWVRGGHQFSFGGNIDHSLVDGLARVFSEGVYPFTGQVTGLGMADFLLGKVSNFQQSAANGLIEAQWFFGLYAQDTWKVSPRLTVNYGLRWEPFFPIDMKDQKIFNFSLQRYQQGVVSKIYPNAPAGFYYPGDPGFNGNSSMTSQWKNFQPRIGFAWDPKGDGKMSIRGGAGISYDYFNEMLHHNTTTASPFGGRIVVPAVSLDNPYANIAGGAPFPYVSSPGNGRFSPFGSFQPIPPNLKTMSQYSWNLAVQRQMTNSWFLSASYVGSQAIHMLTSVELNAPQFLGLGACTINTATGPVNYPVCSTQANENQRRALSLLNPVASQNVGFVTQYDDGATQSYNGLLLNTIWRAGRNANINANYTWSHCIGDQTIGNLVPNPGQNYEHIGNRAADRGDCIGDRRQNFNLTAVAQSPQFANNAMRMVGSGWTISAIYRLVSGAPLTALSGVDTSLTGESTAIQRPNQVLANPYATSSVTNNGVGIQFLNAGAFAQAAPGTFGNAPFSGIVGPKYWQFDMALSREFRVREGQRLEIRAEAFNILNGFRALTNTNTPFALTLSSPNTFGVILAASDPRIMQFALKYTF